MPKRDITRLLFLMSGRNGGSADQTIRAAADPVTLVRTILQGAVNNIGTGGSALTINVELWRSNASAGAVLPTMSVAGGTLPYGDNDDLLWAGLFSIMRETTAAGSFFPINIDMKGNRKLSRTDDLIIRYGGSSSMVLNMMSTMFFKEA